MGEADDGRSERAIGVRSTLFRLQRDDGDLDASAPTLAPVGDHQRVVATDVTLPSSSAEAAPLSEVLASSEQRYVQRELLGEGGMGSVAAMWDTDLMRELAVKRLRPELRHDPELLASFLWEARVTASLDHPNIVPLHDLALDAGGEPYFTMKRVGGVSLETVIERLRAGDPAFSERFPLPRRLRLMMQVCQAVGFAHERGILHRDLKPANVMIGSRGEVQVMDWGLAMPLPDERADALRALWPGRDRDASLSGTPLYMSPEQAAQSSDLDERSDVYSLGVMLYELASLGRPYEGRTVFELLQKITDGEIRPLEEAPAAVPRSLATVIDKALALDRQQRYASTDTLADDVERVLDGRTPSTEDASLARRAARYYAHPDARLARVPMWAIELLLCGTCLLGGGVGVLLAPQLGTTIAYISIIAGTLLGVPSLVRWFGAGAGKDRSG